jgi:Ser/Thr protein kinase RdoA (MazF antagonist)
VAIARELGLPSDSPELLSSRGNVLVHLAPAPVVARVATLTGLTRREPGAWLAREVAAAAHLARVGAPVMAPTTLADPGPHRHDGLPVSLWALVPGQAPDPPRNPGPPSPAEVGRALARLHQAGAGFPGELPLLAPLNELIIEGLDILRRQRAIPPAALRTIAARHAEFQARLAEYLASPDADEVPVLHGDAHPGNVMTTASGPVWIDLEETCRGPRAFDLAVLALTYTQRQDRSPTGSGQASFRLGASPDAAAALDAYAREAGVPRPDPDVLALFAQGRELEAIVWICAMAQHYPARYRAQAQARLAALR